MKVRIKFVIKKPGKKSTVLELFDVYGVFLKKALCFDCCEYTHTCTSNIILIRVNTLQIPWDPYIIRYHHCIGSGPSLSLHSGHVAPLGIIVYAYRLYADTRLELAPTCVSGSFVSQNYSCLCFVLHFGCGLYFIGFSWAII